MKQDRPRPAFIAKAPKLEVLDEPQGSARRHMMELFGRPVLAQKFDQPEPGARVQKLEVALFGTSPLPIVVATAGMSDVAGKDGIRRELVFAVKASVLPQQQEQLCALVASVAANAPVVGAVADGGALLRALPTARMKLFLVMPAHLLPDEADRKFVRRDNTTIELAWLVPVFDDEVKLARAQGHEALWQKFAAVEHDLLDVKRGPVPL